MTDNDNLVVFQDYDGFLLLEKKEEETNIVAEIPYDNMTYAVVGRDAAGQYFIVPCTGTRDAMRKEISAREAGHTEVQTLPIKDIR